MKNFKIIRKIFKENKNLRLSSKVYLCKTYIQNIKFLNSNIENLHKTYKIQKGIQELVKINTNYPLMEKELKELKYQSRKKKFDYIKNKFVFLYRLTDIKYLLDLKNTQNNIKIIFDFLSKHIGNYKKAMQELVEGQREVTQNKNFTFEDGETVQEKMDKFDKKVKEILHINNKK